MKAIIQDTNGSPAVLEPKMSTNRYPATATSSCASARQLNASSDLAEMSALSTIVLIAADVSSCSAPGPRSHWWSFRWTVIS
jgi:hypothetical protein